MGNRSNKNISINNSILKISYKHREFYQDDFKIEIYEKIIYHKKTNKKEKITARSISKDNIIIQNIIIIGDEIYNIDQNNKFKIEKPFKENVCGYKAGKIKQQNEYFPCIIKLLIPDDALLAFSIEESIIRSNKAIPIKILRLDKIFNRKNQKYINDHQSLITKNCYQQNSRRQIIKLCKMIDKISNFSYDVHYFLNENYNIAYSFVFNDNFTYEIGSLIEVENFDGDTTKICVPGIHFYFRQEEALIWHGIINILSEKINGFDYLESI